MGPEPWDDEQLQQEALDQMAEDGPAAPVAAGATSWYGEEGVLQAGYTSVYVPFFEWIRRCLWAGSSDG